LDNNILLFIITSFVYFDSLIQSFLSCPNDSSIQAIVVIMIKTYACVLDGQLLTCRRDLA